MAERTGDRLKSLDGLRGLAILLVMGFHYFHALAAPGNQTEIYPYGDTFAQFYLFKYGYLGVELFFIVSGFVIAMTLETCSSPRDFLARRLSRIWPPLIVCSVATFLFINLVPTPFAATSNQHWQNFLPSLTLTPPSIWTWAYPEVRFVDFVYWSLVVELRFYIFAGLLFWILGSQSFGRNFVLFTCANIAVKTALKFAFPATNDLYSQMFIPSFLPWFAVGIVFYNLYKSRITKTAALIYLLPMFAIIARYSFLDHGGNSPYAITAASSLFFLAFWLIATKSSARTIFSVPILVWVGACSYSIYLIHFEIGSSLISIIPRTFPLMLQVTFVCAIAAVIIGLSWVSYRTIERHGRQLTINLLTVRSRKAVGS